jgi:hypothetical protein
MLEELRLYPRSPAAQTGGCCPGDDAAVGWRSPVLDLSTGFAELPAAPLHRRVGAVPQRSTCTKEEGY